MREWDRVEIEKANKPITGRCVLVTKKKVTSVMKSPDQLDRLMDLWNEGSSEAFYHASVYDKALIGAMIAFRFWTDTGATKINAAKVKLMGEEIRVDPVEMETLGRLDKLPTQNVKITARI